MPTDLVMYALGLITGSYNSLSLPTAIWFINTSSVCLHQTTGLSKVTSVVFPGPKYGLVPTISVDLIWSTTLSSSSKENAWLIEESCLIWRVSPYFTVSIIFLKSTSESPVPL